MSDTKKKNVGNPKVALKRALNFKCNKFCADCDARSPSWASVNLGVFLCIRCAGIHRKLGTHISKVRSLELDTWQQNHVDTMENIGNDLSNEYYEKFGPSKQEKPTVHTGVNKLEAFIRRKYVNRFWVNASGSRSSGSSGEFGIEERRTQSLSSRPKKKPVIRSTWHKRKKERLVKVGQLLHVSSEPSLSTKQRKNGENGVKMQALLPTDGEIEKKKKPREESPKPEPIATGIFSSHDDDDDEYEEDSTAGAKNKEMKVTKVVDREKAYGNVLSLLDEISTPTSENEEDDNMGVIQSNSGSGGGGSKSSSSGLGQSRRGGGVLDEEGYEEDVVASSSVRSRGGTKTGKKKKANTKKGDSGAAKKNDLFEMLNSVPSSSSSEIKIMGNSSKSSCSSSSGHVDVNKSGDAVDGFLNGWKFEM